MCISILFIDNLSRKTPLEEKIDALANAFETLVELVLEIPKNFDKKLSNMYQKLIDLEIKIDNLKSGSNVIKKRESRQIITPQPPPPSPSDVPPKNKTPIQSTGNAYRDLVNEFKEYAKRRNELNKNNK